MPGEAAHFRVWKPGIEVKMGKSDYVVAEFMSRKVVTVPSSATIEECAKVMAGKKVSSAIVKEKEAIAGIVTENDIARRAVAMGLDTKTAAVRRIMTSNVVTIAPEASIYDAIVQLGQARIKHLPVVKKGKLVGIITAMDILRVQPAYIDILRYSEL